MAGRAPARNYAANSYPFRAGSSYTYFKDECVTDANGECDLQSGRYPKSYLYTNGYFAVVDPAWDYSAFNGKDHPSLYGVYF